MGKQDFYRSGSILDRAAEKDAATVEKNLLC